MASEGLLGKLRRWWEAAWDLFNERNLDVESIGKALSPRSVAHFWLMVVRNFLRNRCPVRASALAYTTLLSLIPVLAVVVSVSTGLLKSQGDRPVQKLIDSMVRSIAPQLNLVPRESLTGMETEEAGGGNEQDARKRVVSEITAYIGKIQSGALGLTGVISLIVVAVLLLSNIEATFNDIWGVARGRSWFARVVQYWAAITLGPLILLLAIGLTSGQQWASASSSRFGTNDLVAAPRLLERLTLRQDPVAQAVWTNLSASAQIGLVEPTNGASAKLDLLVKEFNRMLHRERLTEQLVGVGVSLSSNAAALWAERPQGREVVPLNRLALEDAFPGLIAHRTHALGWMDRLRAIVTSKFAVALPFLLLTAGFTLFYGLMPNTRVHWRAAFAGGFVGGMLWQLNNLLQVFYVSKVVSYSRIYGSLAVVPVFLVGLYFSWLILLFGAQVAYAVQHRRGYLQSRQAEGVSQENREVVAVRLMSRIAQAFHRGERAPSLEALSQALGVPCRLLAQIAETLVEHRLLVEANGGETVCHPARPLSQIALQDILEALRTNSQATPSQPEDRELGVIRREVERVREAERRVAAQITLQALVEQSSPGGK